MIFCLKNEIKTLENNIDNEIKKDPNLKEQRNLLESITGIGSETAKQLIVNIDIDRFKNRQTSISIYRAQSSATPIWKFIFLQIRTN